MNGISEVLEWERRRMVPAGIAALIAVLTVAVAVFIAASTIGGNSGNSELLRSIDRHATAQIVSSVLQGIGLGLLAIPLGFLFRAAQTRSETMRGQLIGVVIAAPLFLAIAAILSGISNVHAASEFVSNDVPRLVSHGVALNGDRADKVAADAISDSPLRTLAGGFGLGGSLGFVVAMLYTVLNAMRLGLQTRFWGSLGMALGAVSFLPLPPFYLIWFIALGLLLIGRTPGGRPPAWETGEAMPWPVPGEEAAKSLAAEEPPERDSSEPG
jgi:hypothetical protein